tara:strand:+ start:1171 stop:2904 length:1734 start_codon:yes stop_codon:yes gene_type:complete
MASLNWSGALTTGLIEAGKGLQNFGAMRMKEEYLAEEKEIAASSAAAKRFEFLYEELGKEARNINDALSRASPMGGISRLDPSTKKAFDKQLADINNLRVHLFSALSGVSPTSSITDEVLDKIKKTIEDAQTAASKLRETEEKDTEELDPNSEVDIGVGDLIEKNERENERVRRIANLLVGADINLDKGSVVSWLQENVPGVIDKTLGEGVLEKSIEIVKNYREKNYVGDVLGDAESQAIDADTTSALLNEEIIRGGEPSINPREEDAFPASGSQAAEQEQEITPPGLPGTKYYGAPTAQGERYEDTSDQVRDRMRTEPGTMDQRYTRNPFVEEQLTPGKIDAAQQGLIEQGAPISAEEQAYEDARNEAALAGAGSASIGSEESLTSLFRDVGGPIGEPTGNIVYPTNVPRGSKELELNKEGLAKKLRALVIFAESRGTEYNAVAGTKNGDPNLTRMTLDQIIEKYKNTAVGIGQFKYNEFIKPTVAKYMDIDEETLKSTVFSPEFQEQLLSLAMEDAGITKFLEGRINSATFQKRLGNIFRGLGATKEALPGDPSDDVGNKVRLGGGLLSQSLEGY